MAYIEIGNRRRDRDAIVRAIQTAVGPGYGAPDVVDMSSGGQHWTMIETRLLSQTEFDAALPPRFRRPKEVS